MSAETAAARDALLAVGTKTQRFKDKLPPTDIIIDAILGTGLDREISGEYKTIIDEALEYIYNKTKLITKLKTKMEVDKIFFDPSLTLRGMAETIDLHPNKLSWLLNEKIGKNFNDFINSYRLKAFQEKALDPQNGHLTLLGLAYESGFTSKSVFNDFFKKNTGLTPKAWVKQAKTS